MKKVARKKGQVKRRKAAKGVSKKRKPTPIRRKKTKKRRLEKPSIPEEYGSSKRRSKAQETAAIEAQIERAVMKATIEQQKRHTREIETLRARVREMSEIARGARDTAEGTKRDLEVRRALEARPWAESRKQRRYRFLLSFKLEVGSLLPFPGQSKREMLESWALRNNWTSEELWAEYRRQHPKPQAKAAE